jgi:hypothetical protein
MSLVGSDEPLTTAANPPRTTKSTLSSERTAQISTGSNFIKPAECPQIEHATEFP